MSNKHCHVANKTTTSRVRLLTSNRLWLFVVFCFPVSVTGNGVCGDWQRTDKGDEARLLSPNYPDPFPGNLTCTWPLPVPDNTRFNFRIKEFNIGHDDSVSVYLEHPDSGTVPHWTFSGGLDNLTTFTSDQSVWFQLIAAGDPGTSARRFDIEFKSVVTVPDACEELTPQTNGQISGPNTTIGSVIYFSCDPGFVLQGAESVTCETQPDGNAAWSAEVPTCTAPCLWSKDNLGRRGSYYDVPENATVVLSPGYPGDIVGPISCAWQIDAYNGEVNVTLTNTSPIHPPFSLEIWRNRITDFLDPLLTKHLVVNITSLQDSLAVSIPDGWLSVFLKTTVAGASGRFAFTIDRTAITNCSPPPLSNYLNYFPMKNQYYPGDVVTYECQGSRVFIDNKNTTNSCLENAVWHKDKPNSLPVCGFDCRYWSVTEQAFLPYVVSDSEGTLHSRSYPRPIPAGTCNYTFSAKPGEVFFFRFVSLNVTSTQIELTEPIGRSSSITSLVNFTNYTSKTNTVYILVNQTSDSSLDSFALDYRRQETSLRCSEPAAAKSLNWAAQNLSVGSSVRYSCDAPFVLSGDNESTCILQNSTSAVWLPENAICLGGCGGSFVSSNITIVSPLYPKSYASEGRARRCVWVVTNTDDRSFYISIPAINILPTDNLTITDQGDITRVSDRCTSNCSGLSVVTSGNEVTIEFSSQEPQLYPPDLYLFSIRVLSTTRDNCDIPNPLVNGEVIGNDFSEEASVRFICHPPYDLEGSSISTCVRSADGSLVWDSSTPRCVVTDCTPPSTPVVRVAGEGAIASPGYPGSRLIGNQECVWIIRAVSENDQLSLHFRYLDFPVVPIGEAPPRVFIVDLGDDKNILLANVSIAAPTEDITSLSDAVQVEYVGPGQTTQGFRGLYLEYRDVPRAPPSTTRSTSVLTKTTPLTSESTPSTMSSKATEKASSTTPWTEPPTTTDTSTASSLPDNTEHMTRSPEQTEEEESENTGTIVAGVLGPIALLMLAAVAFYVWYRRKYPVRMVLGKQFGKFANPIYEKGASTLTLVKEDTPIATPNAKPE